MFSLIKNLPLFAVGIRAQGEITKEDFVEILLPALKKVSAEYKGINFLLVLETELKNFTAGAWLEDVKVNLSYFLKWNKVAMVSDNKTLEKVSGILGLVAPAEVKIFPLDELGKAIEWISSID